MTANNGTMDAGLHWFVKDGVVYELLECDNLEIFAGRGVQVGVVDSFGNESSTFTMDAQTGVYKKTEGYEGTCALFDLPLDTAKADEAAADAYIEKLISPDENEKADDAEKTPEELAFDKYMEEFEAAEDEMAFLNEHAVLIEGSRKELTMDKRRSGRIQRERRGQRDDCSSAGSYYLHISEIVLSINPILLFISAFSGL